MFYDSDVQIKLQEVKMEQNETGLYESREEYLDKLDKYRVKHMQEILKESSRKREAERNVIKYNKLEALTKR